MPSLAFALFSEHFLGLFDRFLLQQHELFRAELIGKCLIGLRNEGTLQGVHGLLLERLVVQVQLHHLLHQVVNDFLLRVNLVRCQFNEQVEHVKVATKKNVLGRNVLRVHDSLQLF